MKRSRCNRSRAAHSSNDITGASHNKESAEGHLPSTFLDHALAGHHTQLATNARIYASVTGSADDCPDSTPGSPTPFMMLMRSIENLQRLSVRT